MIVPSVTYNTSRLPAPGRRALDRRQQFRVRGEDVLVALELELDVAGQLAAAGVREASDGDHGGEDDGDGARLRVQNVAAARRDVKE